MSLLESGENYLETILMLSKKQSEIHAIDVVNHLGFSKPSVSIMLKKLKDSSYITIDENSHIHLTSSGQEIAERIYERHTTLTQFFKSIGVHDDIAENDACKIEHDLSDETYLAIKKLIKKLEA
ncbi:MAG: metal-dependent transcriptional regulator [Anaeroplasmataceae bacterium]|nr:metal-dependent transcriptional regulator [Anaeroplasmataceae bacterium]